MNQSIVMVQLFFNEQIRSNVIENYCLRWYEKISRVLKEKQHSLSLEIASASDFRSS